MKTFLSILLFFLLIPTINAQQLSWIANLSETQELTVSAVKKDSEGNTYVLGQFKPSPFIPLPGTTRYAGDLFLAKINSLGTTLWKKRFAGSASGFDITIDSKNSVIITGGFVNSLTIGIDALTGLRTSSGFIAKLSKDGEKIWTINTGEGICAGITCDWEDNIYVVSSQSSLTSQILKYNANGIPIFTKKIGTRTISDVAVDSSGNIYFTGTCLPNSKVDNTPITTPAGNIGYISYLVKLNTLGNVQWIQSKNYISFDFSYSLALNGNNIYWYGAEGTFVSFTKKVWKYNTAGSLIAQNTVSTQLSLLESNLLASTGNKVYVLNHQASKLSLLQYNDNLVLESSTPITNNFTKTYAITASGQNVCVVSAYASNTAEARNFSVVNANTSKAATDDRTVSSLSNGQKRNALSIWPNPVNTNGEMSFTYVSRKEGLASIMITHGEIVMLNRSIAVKEGINTGMLLTNDLQNGIYNVQVCLDKECTSKTIVVNK